MGIKTTNKDNYELVIAGTLNGETLYGIKHKTRANKPLENALRFSSKQQWETFCEKGYMYE